MALTVQTHAIWKHCTGTGKQAISFCVLGFSLFSPLETTGGKYTLKDFLHRLAFAYQSSNTEGQWLIINDIQQSKLLAQWYHKTYYANDSNLYVTCALMLMASSPKCLFNVFFDSPSTELNLLVFGNVLFLRKQFKEYLLFMMWLMTAADFNVMLVLILHYKAGKYHRSKAKTLPSKS